MLTIDCTLSAESFLGEMTARADLIEKIPDFVKDDGDNGLFPGPPINAESVAEHFGDTTGMTAVNKVYHVSAAQPPALTDAISVTEDNGVFTATITLTAGFKIRKVYWE